MVQVKDNPLQLRVPDVGETDAWVALLGARQGEGGREVIRRSIELARAAHEGQRRASGEPYLSHVLAVAEIVADLGLDHETVAAAVLHDVIEDSDYTVEDLEELFGETIARLVDGVTKMAVMHDYEGGDSRERRNRQNAESLRKLLLAMVEDIRVVLIKLADRLHNMRTLGFLDPERQQRIARETLDIFAPLANRLGIWQLKWELEDLSLRYIEPADYKRIASLLEERRLDREQYIQQVVSRLQRELARVGIRAEVTGRPKHIYSIWKKMQRKGVPFSEIYDVRAVRILVDDVTACYAALGVVHSLWRHIPKEFDDYIATPKENNYQSLHTAVIGPLGKVLEVQIRTHEMHEHAELGVAAHWAYKEGGADSALAQKINWLRQLLEWKEEETDAGDFISRFKSEVFEDRVYVFTPAGKVVDLPMGATPLDFAYYIHTDVGHRCRGAKVDGNIVPLTYTLKTGQQVEILTSRHGHPSRDWLNPSLGYLRTSRARVKVRAWFKQQDQGKNISEGRAILDRELRRLGLQEIRTQELAERFGFQRGDELLAAIGRGEVTNAQIAGAAQDRLMSRRAEQQPEPPLRRERGGERSAGRGIHILGVGDLMTNLARCCHPVPNDPIVGYITRGRGVTIHRQDCPNVLRLQQQHAERLIEVSWSESEPDTYPVDIRIVAYDRRGLLRDITALLSNEKINVLALTTTTSRKDLTASIRLTMEISDIGQLSRILTRLDQLPNVVEVRREGGGGPGRVVPPLH